MARGGVQTPPRRGAKPAVGEDGSAGAGAAARAVARRGRGADCAGVVETQRSARGYCGRAIRPKQSREKGKKCTHKKKRGGSSAAGGRCQAKKEGGKIGAKIRRSEQPRLTARSVRLANPAAPPPRRRSRSLSFEHRRSS